MNLRLPASLSNVLSLASSRLIASLVAFITTTLIARSLTTAEVGVYSMVIGSCAYLTIASECGLRSVAMSEGARLGDVRSVLWPYIKARFGLALALTPVAFAITAFGYPEYLKVATPILLSSLLVPFHVDWVLLVNRKYNAAGWATASRWLFHFALIAGLHFTIGLTLTTVAVLFTTSWALAIALSWWVVPREYTRTAPTTITVTKQQLLSLGWPVLGGALITQAMLNADLLWIGATAGKANAGIYYMAMTVITAGLILANALNQIALPKYGALKHNPALFAARLGKDLRMVTGLSAVLSLGTIFILPSFITLVFGDKYQGSADMVAYLAPYLVAYHIHSLYSACCISLGIQHRIFTGLTSMLVAIPAALLLAARVGSLEAFAYAKCFLFVYAIAVHLWATPSSMRTMIAKQFAAPMALLLGLIALLNSGLVTPV